MECYIAQKIEQALEALCGEEPLAERLQIAKLAHVSLVSNDHFLRTAPDDVRKWIEAFIAADIQKDPAGAATLLRYAIHATFAESGRQDIRMGYEEFDS